MNPALLLGWWLLPLAITVATLVAANTLVVRIVSNTLDDRVPPIAFLVLNALAIIVSLVAWLIWAVA